MNEILKLLICLICLVTLACTEPVAPSQSRWTRVSVVSGETGTVLFNIDLDLATGVNTGIIISPSGDYAYVEALQYDKVLKIDLKTFTVCGAFELGSSFFLSDICLDRTGNTLFVFSGGMVITVDAVAMIPLDSLWIGGDYLEGQPRPDTDLIYISDSVNPLSGISVYDAELNEITGELDYSPGACAFSADGSKFYIQQGSYLCMVDPDSGTVLASAYTGEGVNQITPVDELNTLYLSFFKPLSQSVGGIAAVDMTSLCVMSTLDVEGGVYGSCALPSEGRLFLDCQSDSKLMIVDMHSLIVLGEVDVDPEVMDLASCDAGGFLCCSIWFDNE